MTKLHEGVKKNKVIVSMGSVFISGGVTTAILTTCLPSYTVNNILIESGPTSIFGTAQYAGTSDEQFVYSINGKSKNNGKAPTPSLSILMLGDHSLPSWLSISENKISGTDASTIGEYIFIVQIKADNVESRAPFTTTLKIS